MRDDRVQNQPPRAPRVLIIPPSYRAEDRIVGGGERYALEYAKALSRYVGTTHGLFDLRAGSRFEEALEHQTFRFYPAGQKFGFRIPWQTVRELKAFDLLHLQVFPTPMADLLILLARLRKQTVVLTDHGGTGPCWSSYLMKVHRKLDLNRLAHGVGVVSEYAARFFADWQIPVSVLGGGAHLPEMQPSEAQPRGYALFVGRLLPHKGVLPLIESLDADMALHIVGRPYDPAYLEQLRAAARGKKVEFFLAADDAELRRQMMGANVVVQPSLPGPNPMWDKTELCGLAALEAMAFAKPILVTRTASLPELVEEGKTGVIVPPHDLTALREPIRQFLRNPEMAAEMGRAARMRVEKRYTWDRVARRGLDFYRRLAPQYDWPDL
ncbi:MAG: glycosyltransferase family 4 protein [Verrucomicrobiota bacterium]